MRRASAGFASLLLALALITTACGGDGETNALAEQEASAQADEQSTPEASPERVILATQGVTQASDDDVAYFTAVQTAFQLFGSAAAGAEQDSIEGGETRDAFFQGLLNRGVGTAFVPLLDAIRELEPPVNYTQAHAEVVAGVEQLVAIDTKIRDAVLAKDLLAFFLLNAQLARVSEGYALRAPPNLCRTLSRGSANCSSYDVNEDSVYALALREIAAAMQSTIMAAGQAIGGPAGAESLHDRLAPEEWAELIATLFGNLAVPEEEVIEAMRTLDPPTECSADHARLIAFIETTNEQTRMIAAEAAEGTLQSLRVGDSRVEATFAEQCRTIWELSEEFRPVALLTGRDFDRDCAELLDDAS